MSRRGEYMEKLREVVIQRIKRWKRGERRKKNKEIIRRLDV